MVGHLQSNKAGKAVQLFDVVQSVDSLELATALDSRAAKLGCILPVYLQVNVAKEPQKHGMGVGDISQFCLRSPDACNTCNSRYLCLTSGPSQNAVQPHNLKVVGLMTIAPAVPDPEQARPIFRKLREIRDKLGLEHLSMGMTDDFEVAIEEGATVLRIGRAIFSPSPEGRGRGLG